MSIFKPRVRQGNFLFSVVLTTAKMLFVVILLIAVCGTGILMGVAKAWVETAPELDTSAFDSQARTSFIYDANGLLITDFKGVENRIDAEWNEIPDNLKNAVIAVEDKRFLSHNGVDIKRILGALVTNLLNNNQQGGSTLTQQLIKLTMLSSEQTYKRKLQEAYLALQLERQLSKDEIMLEYLNVIYLGGTNYGVKVAAQDYFGKELRDLSLRECAALARCIRNPYRYNPRLNYYSRKTPEVIEENTDYVLQLMYEQGMITEDEYRQALSETLNVVETSRFTDKLYDNAYYVEYAIYDVVTKMLRKEKLEDNSANRSQMESRLRTGGYQIYTSLDPTIQESVQQIVTDRKGYPETRYPTDRTYKASLGNGEYLQLVEPQVAAAVLDWSTGELLAIIGGRSVPTRRKQLNRAYQAMMPVGSSLKPLAVYGPAFDLGYSPGSPVINAPLRIDGWDSPKGYPSNFSSTGSYTGVESLRVAMNKSHNTAAAQALFTYVGIENSVNYLIKLGVNREHISATGAGLALGASGISMIEMAAGYGAIANKGVYLEPYAFTEVKDQDGNVYLDSRAEQAKTKRRVFEESTAWLLVDVLKGCVATGGTGTKAVWDKKVPIGGKTGTNSDYRGVTFAGMSGYFSCAVWIGCDNYAPLTSNATGGTYAAPLWAAIMKRVHELKNCKPGKQIIPGSAAHYGLVKSEACAVSGMRPTSACAKDVNNYGTTTDYYVSGKEPAESCNMHRTIRLCTRSRKAPSEYCKSVKSYGTIYLPEGHPLRYADYNEVIKYFKGASTDKLSATIGICTVCKSSSRQKKVSAADQAEISAMAEKAQALISRANSILSSGNLSSSQRKKLSSLVKKTQNAIDSGNLSGIKKYGKQLQQLIKKL
ncbi:MAG: penicillin-binding protein [Clostridia bacterium]|nr:penicillin-binding protein [Clostridia bacterium]